MAASAAHTMNKIKIGTVLLFGFILFASCFIGNFFRNQSHIQGAIATDPSPFRYAERNEQVDYRLKVFKEWKPDKNYIVVKITEELPGYSFIIPEDEYEDFLAMMDRRSRAAFKENLFNQIYRFSKDIIWERMLVLTPCLIIFWLLLLFTIIFDRKCRYRKITLFSISAIIFTSICYLSFYSIIQSRCYSFDCIVLLIRNFIVVNILGCLFGGLYLGIRAANKKVVRDSGAAAPPPHT